MKAWIAATAWILSAAPAFAQPAPAPAPAEPAAIDYAAETSWICLPGRTDACAMPQATAELAPAGYGAASQAVPAAAPPIDCFYVYPTVSRDPTLNSDLTPGPTEEHGATMVQFGRFATICRPFAPLYRSATLASIGAMMSGQDVAPVIDRAYQDVRAAWRDYLANRNQGRPFVLVGHSQGSIHLVRLIAEEIEGRPAAAHMLSAIVLGWAVEVPEGRVVGGSFRNTPLCTRTGQTGCVVTYMSFRADSPPPAGSLLGRALRPGMTAGCTNPAALAGGAAPLDSYWFAALPAQPGTEPIAWSSQGAPPTPFLHTRGLATARCAHDGAAGYLAISVNADPADPRTDRIPGDVYLMGALAPGWGLHTSDMPLAQGDLIRLVEAQREAWRRRRR